LVRPGRLGTVSQQRRKMTTTQLSSLFNVALSQRANEISTPQSSRPGGGSQMNLGENLPIIYGA